MNNKIDKKEAKPNTFPSIEKKEIRAVLEKLISNLSKGSSPEAGFLRTFNENRGQAASDYEGVCLNELTFIRILLPSIDRFAFYSNFYLIR